MQVFRNIRNDRLSAWLLVGLFVQLLFFQGLATAYAKAAMTVNEAGPQFVICAPAGTADESDGDPLDRLAVECCSQLCHAVCAQGVFAPASATQPLALAPSTCLSWVGQAAPSVPPFERGLVIGARGPPSFFI